MRILVNQSSAGRVASRLAGHELVLVDKGKVTLGGKEIAAKDAKPDIVWLTFDALMGGSLDLFFDAALGGGVKWMHTQQTGLDSPRYRDVVAKGIPLTNSHAQAPAIAQYVLANVLAETWPVAAARQAQREKSWKRLAFTELGGSQWLVVGFGEIGREIAKRAKAFGARITGINRSARDNHGIADAMATLADLSKLLPNADFVVLAVSHNDATNDLVDAKFVGAMKQGSVIVNIGRGQLIVDEALLSGLEKNAPALAILDVFREEPLPASHPYWSHPKVRVTGHTSSSGNGTLGRADNFFLENLRRFEAGEPLLSPVTAGQL